MGRLEIELKKKKDAGQKILVPFVTGMWPDADSFAAILHALQRGGADAIEVGIPFSDPAADGPVIQRSSQLALERGATLRGIFAAVKKAREEGLTVPLLYMTYFNPVFNLGAENFALEAARSGADGVLVVDLPPEEAGEFAPMVRKEGLDTVFLVAPTTPERRMRKVLAECGGFVYCVSVAGVTGEKKPVTELVSETVGKVRPITGLPVLVGFGVSTPEAASSIARISDGVIIGSALIDKIGDARGAEAARRAFEFVSSVKKAL